jgi:replication factor A2
VDNHELNQVSIVGTIKSVAKLSTNITLVVTDNTGEVDVRQWLDAADAQQDFQAGMRIKIIGHVREFQEKRSILAFKIIPVVDAEEAVHHQLMAQYVYF